MATKKLNLTIQLKRGTTEEWEQHGAVVPAAGEPCLDLTTGHLRFGDGETPYRDLKDAASLYDSTIASLRNTNDELRQNMEFLFDIIGNQDSGIVKDIADLRLYVGEIPEWFEATDVIGYVDESQAAEHPNKDVLDGITQFDVDQWNRAQENVIEMIRVNGDIVPVSGRIADITVSSGGEGGGSPLPDVTDDDNGKFLRVIDGAWAADSLTDVSEEGM